MLGHWAALHPQPHGVSPTPIELSALGTWALQFTPRVAVLEEVVVLEVDASARLFGGLESLHVRIEQGAQELGARVAWAPTSLAALALLRQDVLDGFSAPLPKLLDRLPLEALTAVAAQRDTLARTGCRSLADVRKLPRGGLSRRFGKALLEQLDQAYGIRPQAFEWLTVPETFAARLELMSRVETAPALLFGARRLLVQMAGWLAARRLGTTAFTLRWCHDVMRSKDAGAGGELVIRVAEPTQNVEHLSRLLAEHLAKTELLAPAGDLEMLASEVAPFVEESRSLIPDTLRKSATTDLALERIQARLGAECVRQATLCPDHRLEWMQRWPDGEVGKALSPVRAKDAGAEVYELPLPTWVLEEPLRLTVRQNRPIYQGALQLLLGPDRIEGGWWHRSAPVEGAEPWATNEQPLNVQRDYWLALSPHAGVLWVFQARLAGDEVAWFLHGHFG